MVANAANHDPSSWPRCASGRATSTAVDDRTDRTSLIAVQGPRALEILQAMTGRVDGLADLRYYAALEGDCVAGEPRPVLVARTGYTGEDGFEFFVTPTRWASAVARRSRPASVRARPGRASRRATPCGSRPGCRCTGTSST